MTFLTDQFRVRGVGIGGKTKIAPKVEINVQIGNRSRRKLYKEFTKADQ